MKKSDIPYTYQIPNHFAFSVELIAIQRIYKIM